jgi:hypothetical protein
MGCGYKVDALTAATAATGGQVLGPCKGGREKQLMRPEGNVVVMCMMNMGEQRIWEQCGLYDCVIGLTH